ncbi:hypothetical protein C0995_011090, partial [Termitomyces sp. Mi166
NDPNSNNPKDVERITIEQAQTWILQLVEMISFEKAYFLAQYEALDKLQRETLKRWNYVVLLDHLQSSGGTSFKLMCFVIYLYIYPTSYYPMRELAMTGYLFGSLIQNQLLENILFSIAIRYILDAPNCPPETNLFKFGLQALGQFELRLTKCVHFNMSRISALDASLEW